MLTRVLYLTIAVFSILLREFLTPMSFLLLALSSFRLFSQKTLNQLAINIICLGIFTYYLLSFGKVITPEVGLNFLSNVILLKFMESRKYRDEVMCIFGTILLAASGALFDKTLIYFAFFTLSFFLMLHQLSKLNGVKLVTWKNAKSYSKLGVLTLGLFFLFPRISNPIPFYLNSKGQGEIGYSPEINISSIEKLEENDTKVFWAKLKTKKNQADLYWRGNVVSDTDGWNWTPGALDQGLLRTYSEQLNNRDEYRIFIKAPYLFIFDESPTVIQVNQNTFESDSTNSFNSSYIKSSNRYFAQVVPELNHKEKQGKHLIAHHLSQETVLWIQRRFVSEDLETIINSYRDLVTRENFKYSWSPGKITSLEQFFDKKIGFCTHYASSLALILRVKNFPTRIVSGFQGGRYNPYGEFYEISQNDAHAWVEVWHNNSWKRIDPTSFIAPERVIMDYQEVVSNNFIVPATDIQSGFTLLNDIKLIIGQWDFVFYQFMDQWDAIEQVSFFSRFRITRGHLFIISLATISLMFWVLFRRRDKLNERQKQWRLFLSLLNKEGITYNGSFEDLRTQIKKRQWIHQALSLEILDEFMRLFYAEEGNEKSIDLLMRKFNQ